MTSTILKDTRTARELALGFGYWLAFLLALEPGNIANMHTMVWGAELTRIAGAATLGALSTPLIFALVRRYPIAGRALWRKAAVEVAGTVGVAAGLIFVSCVLADWFLATEHRPFLVALPQELSANGLLLVFCIGGLVAIGHVLHFQAAKTSARETTVVQPLYLRTITAKSRGSITLVPVTDIDWIETQGNYVALHVGTETHLIRETLANIEAALDPTTFTRIHRRTIVATDRIREIKSLGAGDAQLILENGTELRLSRSYRASLNISRVAGDDSRCAATAGEGESGGAKADF